jgi:hypothetical protein
MANPIQGLLDFVLAQKPYHTKILDVLVNYVHEDQIDASVLEQVAFQIGLVFDTKLSDDSGDLESIVELCPRAFGELWDQPGQFQVIWNSGNVVYIRGDVTEILINGAVFEVQEPDGGPGLLTLTVQSSVYDAVTDRTAVTVDPFAPVLWIPNAPPVDNTNTAGEAYALYRLTDGYEVELTESSNTIVIRQGIAANPPLAEYFISGLALEIRDAPASVNNQYRIILSQQLSGTEVLLLTTTIITADETLAAPAELLTAGYGYDEPTFCNTGDPTVVRPAVLDKLSIRTFDQTNTTELFQYFILEADSIGNTFTVEGNATFINGQAFNVIHAPTPLQLQDQSAYIDEFEVPLSPPLPPGATTNVSSPILLNFFTGGSGYAVSDTITLNNTGEGGSGAVITVDAVNAGEVTEFTITSAGDGVSVYTSVEQQATSGGGTGFALVPRAQNVGDPLVDGNNGSYTATSATFNPVTNRTIIGVANVPLTSRTGWIVPS